MTEVVSLVYYGMLLFTVLSVISYPLFKWALKDYYKAKKDIERMLGEKIFD